MPTISPSGDLPSVVNAMNQNIAQQNTNQVTQIFKDDTGTRRVLLGKGKDGFYGMKVSQSGYDVFDATDDQLVFNSSQNVFKIVQSGTVTTGVIAGGNDETITIAHSVGYAPIVMAFFGDSTTTFYPLPFAPNKSYSSGGNVVNNTFCYCFADSTNMYIRAINGTAVNQGPWDFKYYILQETAA